MLSALKHLHDLKTCNLVTSIQFLAAFVEKRSFVLYFFSTLMKKYFRPQFNVNSNLILHIIFLWTDSRWLVNSARFYLNWFKKRFKVWYFIYSLFLISDLKRYERMFLINQLHLKDGFIHLTQMLLPVSCL